jgi:uncharacterized repeat protein (TIGR01451 family)
VPSGQAGTARPAAQVQVSPGRIIAPIGSEVVVVAGICGPDGRLMTNQLIEWTLEPGGVGHFLAFPGAELVHHLIPGTRPKKVDSTYVVSRTGRQTAALTRGTPTQEDDVSIVSGQTWISLSSPVEGTSYVTAFAPGLDVWNGRQQTATIIWADAGWTFPPPAVNPVGSTHRFTTLVHRHSDRSPLTGWIVRYEIEDGPDAGFAPDGARSVEVLTDAFGQATVEIFQRVATVGSNRVAVTVIRPGVPGGSGPERVVLGEGTTTKSWTKAELSIDVTGPSEAAIGDAATYRIMVTNPGQLTTRSVEVRQAIPAGYSLVESRPAATVEAAQARWSLGDLAGGATRVLEITLRAERPGTVNHCATASAGEGFTAQDCVATSVLASALEVAVTGPQRITVGQEATFEILITNRGGVLARQVKLTDRYEPGLEVVNLDRPGDVQADLGDLEPGQSERIPITFRVVRAGELCHTVEVTGDGVPPARKRTCLTAEAAAAEPRPALGIRASGPAGRSVGQSAEFAIEVTNTGNAQLRNVRVAMTPDRSLDPTDATEGNAWEGDDLVWRLASLEPGQSIRYELRCRCRAAASRACVAIRATADGGAEAADQACLAIQGTPSQISLSIAALREPAQVGSEIVYDIRVTNRGDTPDRDLTLTITLPPSLSPQRVGTSGPARASITGQTVTFLPVAEIRAGETLTYRVTVRAIAAGEGTVTATVGSAGLATPLVKDKASTVFSAP